MELLTQVGQHVDIRGVELLSPLTRPYPHSAMRQSCNWCLIKGMEGWSGINGGLDQV